MGCSSPQGSFPLVVAPQLHKYLLNEGHFLKSHLKMWGLCCVIQKVVTLMPGCQGCCERRKGQHSRLSKTTNALSSLSQGGSRVLLRQSALCCLGSSGHSFLPQSVLWFSIPHSDCLELGAGDTRMDRMTSSLEGEGCWCSTRTCGEPTPLRLCYPRRSHLP